MVPELARTAVMIKCRNKAAGLLGNYEIAYGLGLLCRLFQIEAVEYHDIPDLREQILFKLDNIEVQTEDTNALHLVELMKKATPDNEMDDQMRELYQMGLQEANLWNERGY